MHGGSSVAPDRTRQGVVRDPVRTAVGHGRDARPDGSKTAVTEVPSRAGQPACCPFRSRAGQRVA